MSLSLFALFAIMSTFPGYPPTSAMDASHRPLHSMTTCGQAKNKHDSFIEAASLQSTDDPEPTAEAPTKTDSHEPSVGVSRPPPMPVISEALLGSKDAPTSSSDIMILLQYRATEKGGPRSPRPFPGQTVGNS